ncbi:MAG: TIGR04282 family arsenosugar biosynthesis glycosyltransferase [Pseudomonadota bacterium]
MTRHLVIFVKEPRPGRVKTRLAADIGPIAATWWFRHQTARLLRRVGGDPRWQTSLAVAPDRQGMASRVWPADLPRLPQGGGDLGARMARVMRAMPPGPVIIIGSDIPGIHASHIDGAFQMLGRHDAVLGPAPDGGYWLIGLRRGGQALPQAMLQGVRWSGPHAMADTIASLAPLRTGYTATLQDVDTVEDLARSR